MAITATPKYELGSEEATTSVPDRDYYSGKFDVSQTTYEDANKHDFGFLANGLLIRNAGGGELVFQFPRNDGKGYDNGTIPAGESFKIEVGANKPGVNVRVDSGSTSDVEIIAWA